MIEEGGGQVEVDEQEVERLRENMRLKEMQEQQKEKQAKLRL